jgi:hypothetical protein
MDPNEITEELEHPGARNLLEDVGDTPTAAKALLVRGLASVDILDGVPDEYIAARYWAQTRCRAQVIRQ